MATLEEQVAELTKRVQGLETELGIGPIRENLPDFKLIMTKLDHRSLETIFQGEGDGDLAIAFMGQERDLLENVRQSLSKARWKRVYGVMKRMMEEGVSKDGVQYAQEALRRKIQSLEDMGRIVVSHRTTSGPGVSWDEFMKRERPKLDLSGWKPVLEGLAG